jgi:hypothetical protein
MTTRKARSKRSGGTTAGDVLRMNITPPSTSFPWVRIFRYDHGVRGGGATEAGGVNTPKDRATAARIIGEEVIRVSKVLQDWFR